MPEPRALTIAGAGGCGKTRLAVEALGGKLEIHAVFDDADIKLTA